MTIAYFQTHRLPADSESDAGDKIRRKFCAEITPMLLQRPEINLVSVFAPDHVSDPYVDDGPPPDLVFQFNVSDPAALGRVFDDAAIVAHLKSNEFGAATSEVFEVMAFDIEGVAELGHRSAPMSYNVRYYAPVENDEVFVDFYLKHHPQILAELPGIRNVFCYIPVADQIKTPVPVSNCILGNEVVFDTVEALNESMKSEVRHRLREDYNTFPVRPGPNTHYAMQRQDFS